MAVIGIRTAWNAVRSAVNMVKQYNSQVSTDFEYMGYCIANVVAPAVQGLIKLLYTLLNYVNAVSMAWFGVNLFANSSVKAFQKIKSSTDSTAKAIKEIQKSSQGFDEMSVLSDSSNSSSGVGTSVGGIPSMDLSGMQGEVPSWLQWIIDNKEAVLGIITGITTGLISMKLLGLDPIMSLGIGLIVAGITEAIQGIINFINDPSWENFTVVLEGVSIALMGIALVIGTLTGNWIPLLIATIILIVTEIIKHWDEIKEILGKVGQWIYDNVITPVWNFIQKGIDWVVAGFWTLVSTIEGIFTTIGLLIRAPFDTLWDIVQGVFGGIKNILQGILTVFKGIFTGDIKTVLEGFKQIFKGIFDSLWSIAKAPLNLIIRGINSLIKGANKIKFDVPDWVPGLGGKTFGFNIKEIPLLAQGTVVSRPTPAIIGEAGTEMVAPLENNLEWLDILADKLASRIGSGGGSYIIQMDSRAIQRGIARRQQELAFAKNGR